MEEKSVIDCSACNAECCRYVATEIDEPVDSNDIDNIRWYLMHENVNVFIDHDDNWYIEFITPCRHIGKDNKCLIYDKRPAICSAHGVDDGICEFHGGEPAYKKCFTNETEFEKYIKKRK